MTDFQQCECCGKRFDLDTVEMHSTEDGCWLCPTCIDGFKELGGLSAEER